LLFITAFTLGHSITLIGATLLGITANDHLIDAVIALSVLYKGFENLDGFKRWLNTTAPNLLYMVFGFGLIHGFGLSTRLQQLSVGHEATISKIVAFNLGVEIGQVLALIPIIFLINLWRKRESYTTFQTATNWGLVLAGAGLFVFQMVGFWGHLR
jgi:HupE / UreJ protein